jgi:hypothetical protein
VVELLRKRAELLTDTTLISPLRIDLASPLDVTMGIDRVTGESAVAKYKAEKCSMHFDVINGKAQRRGRARLGAALGRASLCSRGVEC